MTKARTLAESISDGGILADGSISVSEVSGAAPLSSPAFTGGVDVTGNLTISGTVDGRDVATDGTKLDGIEAGATADQTAAQIKTAYESNADTNAFTDTEKSKLSGIEAGADVTDAAGVEPLVDAHLNTSTASAGNLLSWTGSDYAWAAGVPSGIIAMWSGSTLSIPSGWVLCDGLNSTPDLRDRFIVGAGSTYAVGDTGGANTVALAAGEMPSHTHGVGNLAGNTSSVGDHTHTGSTSNSGNHAHSGSTSSSGNHAHNGSTSNTGSHSHNLVARDGNNSVNNFSVQVTQIAPNGSFGTSAAGAHSHNFTTAGAGDHAHNFTTAAGGDHAHNFTTAGGGSHSHTLTISGDSGASGSGTAHENRPPYYALAYIMKT